jgi:hypothetical protein
MRAKQKAVFLRQVADIRSLQRAAAEADALKATAQLRKARLAEEEAGVARDKTEHGWQTALSAPTFVMDITSLWARALLGANARLEQARAETNQAQTDLDDQRHELRGAISRQQWAGEISRTASKSWTRHRDEAALNIISDQWLQRRGAK